MSISDLTCRNMVTNDTHSIVTNMREKNCDLSLTTSWSGSANTWVKTGNSNCLIGTGNTLFKRLCISVKVALKTFSLAILGLIVKTSDLMRRLDLQDNLLNTNGFSVLAFRYDSRCKVDLQQWSWRRGRQKQAVFLHWWWRKRCPGKWTATPTCWALTLGRMTPQEHLHPSEENKSSYTSDSLMERSFLEKTESANKTLHDSVYQKNKEIETVLLSLTSLVLSLSLSLPFLKLFFSSFRVSELTEEPLVDFFLNRVESDNCLANGLFSSASLSSSPSSAFWKVCVGQKPRRKHQQYQTPVTFNAPLLFGAVLYVTCIVTNMR